MVKYDPARLDAVFGALADRTRRGIVARLARGGARVTDLAEPFALSLPAISRHLRVLEAAGLIARQRSGREHRLRLEPAPLKELADWLALHRQFWEASLESLAALLEAEPPGSSPGSTLTRTSSPRRSASAGRRRETDSRNHLP